MKNIPSNFRCLLVKRWFCDVFYDVFQKGASRKNPRVRLSYEPLPWPGTSALSKASRLLISLKPSHCKWILGLQQFGCSKNRGTPKWMVCNGKPYSNLWFGGTTILGNPHFKTISRQQHKGDESASFHFRFLPQSPEMCKRENYYFAISPVTCSQPKS